MLNLSKFFRTGYNYTLNKVGGTSGKMYVAIPVNKGQLAFEACHLNNKLIKRRAEGRVRIPTLEKLECNPIFEPCDGDIELWEKIK